MTCHRVPRGACRCGESIQRGVTVRWLWLWSNNMPCYNNVKPQNVRSANCIPLYGEAKSTRTGGVLVRTSRLASLCRYHARPTVEWWKPTLISAWETRPSRMSVASPTRKNRSCEFGSRILSSESQTCSQNFTGRVRTVVSAVNIGTGKSVVSKYQFIGARIVLLSRVAKQLHARQRWVTQTKYPTANLKKNLPTTGWTKMVLRAYAKRRNLHEHPHYQLVIMMTGIIEFA